MNKTFSESKEECREAWQALKEVLYHERYDIFKYLIGALIMVIVLALFGRIK